MKDQVAPVFKEFINDIISVFPEYKERLELYYNDVLNDGSTSESLLTEFMDRIYVHRKRIANKDSSLFDSDPIILQNISFKLLWKVDASNSTKESIWKYLQTFSILNITNRSDNKINEAIQKLEDNDTVEDKSAIKEMKILQKLQESLSNNESDPEQTKNINEIESIFENTGIGKMAKEITDSLNIDDGNTNIQDVFQGNIMGDIFKKITAQVSSEENHSQLLTEATTICSDMQDNPLFSSLLNMQSNLMSGLMKDSLAMNPENNKDTKSIPVNSNQMEITNMSSKKKKQKQRRQSQQEKSSVQVNKVAIEEVDID